VSDLPVPTTDSSGRRWVQTLREILRRLDRIESTSDVPTPAMVWWPSELSPPPGWVRGGAELSRETYGGLFAKVGVSGGAGNGYTTFNAPNLPTPLPTAEAERYVGDPDQPVFENGWVNFGGGNGTARFWRDPLGVVHLAGIVKNPSAVANTIFTLPEGYRPVSNGQTFGLFLPDAAAGAFGLVNVQPTATGGTVSFGGPGAAATTYVSLDGISFRATPPAPPVGFWIVRA
jgi:hypothetical protein